MGNIIALLILAGIIWFWFDSTRTKELAAHAAEKACKEMSVQFLDQTVSLEKLKRSRNHQGRLTFLRIYGFDFSIHGDQRFHGRAKMLGQKLLQVQLDRPEGLVIEDEEA